MGQFRVPPPGGHFFGGIWGFWGVFFEFFRMVFGMRFLIDVQLVFFERFLVDVLVFRSARKWATSECCNTLLVKPNISQGARLRRRSGEGDE